LEHVLSIHVWILGLGQSCVLAVGWKWVGTKQCADHKALNIPNTNPENQCGLVGTLRSLADIQLAQDLLVTPASHQRHGAQINRGDVEGSIIQIHVPQKNSSRHERKKCKAMILENIAVGIQSFLMGNVSHVGDAKRKKSAPTNRCIYFQSPVYLDLYIYREILPTGSIFHHPCSSKPLFLQVPILPLRFPALTHPALLVTLKLLRA